MSKEDILEVNIAELNKIENQEPKEEIIKKYENKKDNIGKEEINKNEFEKLPEVIKDDKAEKEMPQKDNEHIIQENI